MGKRSPFRIIVLFLLAAICAVVLVRLLWIPHFTHIRQSQIDRSSHPAIVKPSHHQSSNFRDGIDQHQDEDIGARRPSTNAERQAVMEWFAPAKKIISATVNNPKTQVGVLCWTMTGGGGGANNGGRPRGGIGSSSMCKLEDDFCLARDTVCEEDVNAILDRVVHEKMQQQQQQQQLKSSGGDTKHDDGRSAAQPPFRRVAWEYLVKHLHPLPLGNAMKFGSSSSSSSTDSAANSGKTKSKGMMKKRKFQDHAKKMKELAQATPAVLSKLPYNLAVRAATYSSSSNIINHNHDDESQQQQQPPAAVVDDYVTPSVYDAVRILDPAAVSLSSTSLFNLNTGGGGAGGEGAPEVELPEDGDKSWTWVVAVKINSEDFNTDEEHELSKVTDKSSISDAFLKRASVWRSLVLSHSAMPGRRVIFVFVMPNVKKAIHTITSVVFDAAAEDDESSPLHDHHRHHCEPAQIVPLRLLSSGNTDNNSNQTVKNVAVVIRCVPATRQEYASHTPWCEDLSIELKLALKFGSKTGVYTGTAVASALAMVGNSRSNSDADDVKNSKHHHHRHHDDQQQDQQQLVKHYNLLQYVNGFPGLHLFLTKPVFVHPAIHTPTSACLTSHPAFANSVLQFQPLVKRQQSLYKFMRSRRISASKNSDNVDADGKVSPKKVHQRIAVGIPWATRLDMALQLMCGFTFLHSHPRGPFSFDDNHPDQFLVIENNNNNHHHHHHHDQNEEDETSWIDVTLKMVDIDTLQKAQPRDNHDNSADGASITLPPGARTEQPAFGSSKNKRNMTFVFDDANAKTTRTTTRRPNLEDYTLNCRCFYCSGRSNCIFVNSYEGYHSCGQAHDGKGVSGDDGNREMFGRRSTTRDCTLLTDSWYLGQLLFFMIRGDLLYPTFLDMHNVIKMMSQALATSTIASSASATSSRAQQQKLQDMFSLEAKKVSDDEEYNNIVRDLLVYRIPPEEAQERLMALCDRHDRCRRKHRLNKANIKEHARTGTHFVDDACPSQFEGDDSFFQGLHVRVGGK